MSTQTNHVGNPVPRNGANGFSARTLNQIMATLEPLKEQFADPEINEIMINGPDDVFITRGGLDVRLKVELSKANITSAITLVAGYVEKEVGEKSKSRQLSARLPGFRIEAVLPPVAVKGPTMCIRRHASRIFKMEEYLSAGIITEKRAQIVHDAIEARENFLVGGGTGSGKTTLMNTVLDLIPPDERLYVIETVHELQISAPNHVLIECDEDLGVTPRLAVRTGMRMAPKRIIVGELRGPEAYDWLDAANTGHPGSGATIHANSAPKCLGRLQNLLLKANMGVPLDPLRIDIGETVQWIFFIKRDGAKREISEVCRVHGYDPQKGEYEMEHF